MAPAEIPHGLYTFVLLREGVLGTASALRHRPFNRLIRRLDGTCLAVNAVLTVNNELLSASILSAVGILLVHIFIYSSGANTAEWTVKDAHITLNVSLIIAILLCQGA